MPRGERAKRTKKFSTTKRSGAGRSRTRVALFATRRRLSRFIEPARPPELSGAVVEVDTTPWQGVVRACRTSAFRMALIAGVSFAWIGTATLSSFVHGPTPKPVREQAHTPSDSTAQIAQQTGSGDNPDSASDAAPPSPARIEVSDDFLRNYATVAAELDRQSGRDEVPVSPQPPLLLSHCPTCTESLSPGPEQSPDAPQSSVGEPLARPLPAAVEQPVPQGLPTISDQPVSLPTERPSGAPLPGGLPTTGAPG
jgi:hypothetical protein